MKFFSDEGIQLVGILYFLNLMQLIDAIVLPSIVWDPRNPLFNCSSNGHTVINVHPYDSLILLCPHPFLNNKQQVSFVPNDYLYENVYLLQQEQKNDFLACNATDAKLLTMCNKPRQLWYYSFVFKEFSGSRSALIFKPGKDYFLLGTGNKERDKLNNKVGGSCLPSSDKDIFPLKLQIHVCSWKEINVFKNCSVCNSQACYLKGCSIKGDWESSGIYKRIDVPPASAVMSQRRVPQRRKSGFVCSHLQKRSNYYYGLDMSYSEMRFKDALCPLHELECSKWLPVDNKIYNEADETGRCFALVERTCSLRSEIIAPFIQTRKQMVPCTSQVHKLGYRDSNCTVNASLTSSSRILYFLVIPMATLLMGLMLGYLMTLVYKRRTRIVQSTRRVYQNARGKTKARLYSKDKMKSSDTQFTSCSSGLMKTPEADFDHLKHDLRNISEEIFLEVYDANYDKQCGSECVKECDLVDDEASEKKDVQVVS